MKKILLMIILCLVIAIIFGQNQKSEAYHYYVGHFQMINIYLETTSVDVQVQNDSNYQLSGTFIAISDDKSYQDSNTSIIKYNTNSKTAYIYYPSGWHLINSENYYSTPETINRSYANALFMVVYGRNFY